MAALRLWSEKVMIRLGEKASDARIRAGRIGIIAADSNSAEPFTLFFLRIVSLLWYKSFLDLSVRSGV
jgi:hypothetical protein